MIDGDALLSLTERALELMIPVIGHRMKFLKLIDELKKKIDSDNLVEVNKVSNQQVNDGASTSDETANEGADPSVLKMKKPKKTSSKYLVKQGL